MSIPHAKPHAYHVHISHSAEKKTGSASGRKPAKFATQSMGVSTLDPGGTGFSTPEAREGWWDENCFWEFYYAMVASFAAGNQVANYETLVMAGDIEGTRRTFKCEGIWTYSVDEQGKLLTMYGYWDQEDMIATETLITGEYDHQHYVE